LDVALRSHLASVIRPLEIVISDYGSENHRDVRAIADKHGCKYIYTPADVWSRSAALNAGIKVAGSHNILTTDADILFSPKAHEILLHNLAHMPHSVQIIQCRDLPEGFGSENLSSFDWDKFLTVSTVRPRWGMGGSATFRKSLFFKLHGFDERMTVWGGEDDDFVQRARRSGAVLNWIEDREAQIYHIWHAPDSRGISGSAQKSVKRNRKILEEDRSVLRNLNQSYRTSTGYVPTVSIVISTRNRPELLNEAIESCLKQTYQDFEILVVDDGSGEDTRPMLEHFGDDRIRTLRFDQSRGLAFARNRANAIARGEFIAIHDDDDLMLPQRLEHQLSAITDDSAGSYGGWIDFNDETGKIAANPGRMTFDRASLIFAGKTLVHAGSLIRRKVFEHYKYNEAFLANSDYHVMNRIARGNVRLVHCGHYVILRRLHSHNLSGTHASTQRSTSSISQAMSRAMLSIELEQAYRTAAGNNQLFSIDPAEIIEAAAYLPHRLLRKTLRVELEEPLSDFMPEDWLASIIPPGRQIGIEFAGSGSNGIQALTVDLCQGGAMEDEIISLISRAARVRHAKEMHLPLAYPDFSAFEADCGAKAEVVNKDTVHVTVERKLSKAFHIIGKHCRHCSITMGDESHFQLALPRLKRPIENLLLAKLNGLIANS